MSKRKETQKALTAKRRRVGAEPSVDLLDRLPNELLFEIMTQFEHPETLHEISKIQERTRDLSSHPVVRESVWRAKLRRGTQGSKNRTLVKAALYGRLNLTRWLIAEGADPTFEHSCAFRNSAYGGYLESMKILFTAGADPTALSSNALFAATINGHLEVVRWLVENMEVDLSSYSLKLAIEEANLYNHFDTAEYINNYLKDKESKEDD